MTLSLSSNWKRAFAADRVSPMFMCVIDAGSNTYTCYSAGPTEVGFDPPSPFGAEIDVLDRRFQVSSVTVPFHDSWIRPIVYAQRLKGAKITLTLGTTDLDPGDFAPYFVGLIDEVRPDGHIVEVECLDVLSMLALRKVSMAVYAKHPLDVMMLAASAAGIPPSLIDTNSFDPDNSTNEPIGHFTVSRYPRTGSDSGFWSADAIEVIYELVQLVGGSVYVDENGKLRFALFNPASSNVRTLTVDDYAEPRQESTGSGIVNRVIVKYKSPFASTEISDGEFSAVEDNTASQTAYAYPGESSRVFDHAITTPWLSASFVLLSDPISNIHTTIRVTCTFGWMSGCREMIPGPQPSFAMVTPSRPAYLVFPNHGNGYAPEIVRVTSVAYEGGSLATPVFISSETGEQVTSESLPARLVLTVERGALGTVPQSHTTPFVKMIDLTMIENITRAISQRFAEGVSPLSIVTSLEHYDLQVGDFVGLVWPEFLSLGKDGLDGTEKFEIIGKDPDLASDPPGITFKLASVETHSPTRARTIIDMSLDAPNVQGIFERDRLKGDVSGNKHVREGMDLTSLGGLALAINAGTVAAGQAARSTRERISLNLAGNRDSYVAKDVISGAVTARSVPVGDRAPRLGPTETFLGKVTTTSSGVSLIDMSQRQTKSIATQHTAAGEGQRGMIRNGKFSQASRG